MADSHILLFVSRIEGGDLMNLQYVAEGLLKINHRLTLAIDMRTDEVREILQGNVKFCRAQCGNVAGGL